MKKYISLLCVLFCLGNLMAFSQVSLSKVLNIRAENNALLIDVASGYPKAMFSQSDMKDKFFIQFTDTQYGDNFKFSLPLKENLLDQLDFISDVSIGKNTNEHNVLITLSLKENQNITPQILKALNNTIEIGFTTKVDTGNDLVDLYNEAVEEHTNGDIKKAENLYRYIISQDDNFFLAKYNLAKIYIDDKNYEDAILLLESLPQDKEENEYLIEKTIGTIYYLKDNLKKARQLFESLAKSNPDSYEPYFYLGLIYEKKKSFKKAKENFKKAVELKDEK